MSSRPGGSKDGANGFKLCGAVVSVAGERVSSVTQDVEGKVLRDPLSLTAGQVSKGIREGVSVSTQEVRVSVDVEGKVPLLNKGWGCTVANIFSDI